MNTPGNHLQSQARTIDFLQGLLNIYLFHGCGGKKALEDIATNNFFEKLHQNILDFFKWRLICRLNLVVVARSDCPSVVLLVQILVCWLPTFISPDKISKPENQSRHDRTVKILQDLDKKIYNLRNAHILSHHNFQLFYHSHLPFNAILLSLLRTNTSSHHFENPYLIADDVTCERSQIGRASCRERV